MRKKWNDFCSFGESINFIRNFCVIAHIDHGKSTLADRFLELTKTVPKEKMRPQYLDQMPLEREKGVTIKLQPVTMEFEFSGSRYILNLIDTPGHADFFYEVSRSLASVEGVILLVDASQGIQAQTISNLRLALEENLVVIPVLNKIDLPHLDLNLRKKELAELLNISEEEIILVSAKTGQGVEKVLEAVIKKIPPPQGNINGPLRALIFDSIYSQHRGVIAYLKVVDGQIKKGDELEIINTKTKIKAEEVGIFRPQLTEKEILTTGSIGYLVTGLKDIKKCRVGYTITKLKTERVFPLPGYKEIKPMIFSTLYNRKSEEARRLGEALEKLQLNDASLFFEPEKSTALGLGYRCGFLGLFHLEITKERLKREYNLDVIATKPSVVYRVWLRGKKNYQEIRSPEDFPTGNIEKVEEPIMKVEIITPQKYLSKIVELIKGYHGQFLEQSYLTSHLSIDTFSSLRIKAKIPLSRLIIDFYDKLKNISAGFASMSYEFFGYEEADLLRLDILVAGQRQEAFSTIVYRQDAYRQGRKIVEFLKENLPRQMFEVKIQAVLGWQPQTKGQGIGGKIIASEKLPAIRKDVTAKLYGGDVTRKMKLLQKQKEGKKKLLRLGKVDIPADIYIKMLKKEI
ncbi:MAG: translation elongation factor 4 [Patescibacteria group bacterium]